MINTLKNALGLLLAIGLCGQLFGQNLIPNPSFESYTSCPPTNVSCTGRVPLAAPWFIPPSGVTPDYFNECHVAPFPGVGNLDVDVPSNMFGYQVPHHGVAYVGFFPLNEYFQVPLTSPLVAGTTYNFSMWVNLANTSINAIDGIGAFFSVGAVNPSMGWLNAQISNPSNNYLTDTTNWTQIGGSFVAAGGEDHLMIGNFYTPKNIIANGGGIHSCYYYVDSMELSTTLPVEMGYFQANEGDDEIILNWNTYTETNNKGFEVYRSTGDDFYKVGWVFGNNNSNVERDYTFTDMNVERGVIYYYKLKQIDFDGNSKTSNMIFAELEYDSEGVKIYPNPANTNIMVEIDTKDNITIFVFNLFGDLIYENTLINNSYNIEHLPSGMYIIKVRTRKKEAQQRILIRN